jgi:alpha-L-rhamnosidase
MDVAAFFTKWLTSLEDDQRPSGAFPDYAPMPFLLFEPSAGWMDAGIICPYTLYKVYGDTRIINKHYKAMAKFMDFLIKNSTDFLRSPAGNSWGDWLSIDEKTPKDLIATAYFAYDAKLMAEMAAAIGRLSESRGYAELFEKIKKAFNQAYVSANGRIVGDTQTCYALALYMDLLPENLKIKASARLVELIGERNWHLATGFLGTRHLLPVLTEFGYPEIAYRLLTNKTYPSWGYAIENGATTIWERWNGFTKTKGFENPGMNSFNHYAFGSVCEWMFAYMAGIDTDKPGFKKIIIRPELGAGDITHASAIYHSMHGPIKSAWKIIKNRLILDVTIPANTTATVYMPTQDIAAVTEGDRPAVNAEKVEFLQMQGNKAVFAVGSGRYQFASFLPPRKAERSIKATRRASTKSTRLYESVSNP